MYFCIWTNWQWKNVYHGKLYCCSYFVTFCVQQGPPEDPGVNTRALGELFRVAKEREEDYKIELSVSILEIYNETIHDLLVPASKVKQKKYEIKQGPDGMYVPDLTNVAVKNVDEVFKVIQLGNKNRSTSSTDMNEHSSRSHA